MKLQFRRVHGVSDRIELRMAKAVRVAADRVRERVPFRKIEEALSWNDLRAVTSILAEVDVADAYLPSAEIVREAFVKGGKVAAEDER